MSTAEEIAAAIRDLPDAERARLAESLPTLVRQLEGDARLEDTGDPTPSPKLTALLEELAAGFRENPEQFRELPEEESDKRK